MPIGDTTEYDGQMFVAVPENPDDHCAGCVFDINNTEYDTPEYNWCDRGCRRAQCTDVDTGERWIWVDQDTLPKPDCLFSGGALTKQEV